MKIGSQTVMGNDARIARPGLLTGRAGEARSSTQDARVSSFEGRASIRASIGPYGQACNFAIYEIGELSDLCYPAHLRCGVGIRSAPPPFKPLSLFQKETQKIWK